MESSHSCICRQDAALEGRLDRGLLTRLSSDVSISGELHKHCDAPLESITGVQKRSRYYAGFWSRVGRGEISLAGITSRLGKLHHPIIPQPVPDIANMAIIATSMADYSYKATPFGDVYYSPRFQDNKYIYRFVVLTRGVRNEAFRILKHSGRSFLTEYQIIHQLRIDLSPGWEHFMLYRNKLEELILRRRLGT